MEYIYLKVYKQGYLSNKQLKDNPYTDCNDKTLAEKWEKGFLQRRKDLCLN